MYGWGGWVGGWVGYLIGPEAEAASKSGEWEREEFVLVVFPQGLFGWVGGWVGGWVEW